MNKKLSMKELRQLCRQWAEQIKEYYTPDLIVFISKSGFIIADEFSRYFRIKMDEISAHRAGGRLRKIIAPIFAVLPLKLRNKIVGAGIMYRINGKKSERNVEVPESLIRLAQSKHYQKILLIDDSIDTGWTFLHVYNKLRNLFSDAEIKTLALIRMKYAKERFDVDYHLYDDVLLLTPAQVDHEEHPLFLAEYETWQNDK